MLNDDDKLNFAKSVSIDFDEFETKSANEILSWSLEQFSPKIAFASSFGAEDVVLIDLMVKINKKLNC